jgi:putative nucleotidyltransferase with HDIG domain
MSESQSNEIRILFVDDEPRILDGLRRMLRCKRREWTMRFANSADEALEQLDREPCDVLVTDIRMPGMTGVELMEEVRSRYPHVVRIALSGQASRETVLRSAGPAHQYLPKPCDADAIKGTLDRLNVLREMITSSVIRGAIASLESLPSLPDLCDEVTDLVQQDRPDIDAIADVIARDTAMGLKVVQLVSSGFFGPPRFVHDPRQAVTILGVDTLKPLVLAMKIFTRFEGDQADRFDLDGLWRHSLHTAGFARRIAELHEAPPADVDASFMAGLFHDVGKAVLAWQLPQESARADQQARDGTDALAVEREVFHTSHAEVGAYLLGIWGLIDPVLEAVAYHHRPADSTVAEGFSPLLAVHLANHWCHPDSAALDEDFLEATGLADRPPAWREQIDLPSLQETEHV